MRDKEKFLNHMKEEEEYLFRDLDLVVEECSELIHAVMKARRFGLFTCHPDNAEIPENCNLQQIIFEIEDVRKALDTASKTILHFLNYITGGLKSYDK